MIPTLVVIGLLVLCFFVSRSAAARVPAWPWLALARCETGIDWQHWTRSYEGAYGFTHGAWRQWRLPGYPRRADRASPEQQTRVAMRIQRAVGWGAWPVCSIRLGLR